MYLPGIATGTCWQQPVVSERERPHRSFPVLPHTFAVRSVRLSLLAWTDSPGYVGLAAGAGLGHMAISAPHRQPCVLRHPVLQGTPPQHPQTCPAPRHAKAHRQMQFNDEERKCTTTHAGAAVANRNTLHSTEAVSSETDATTRPHPVRCWLLNGSREPHRCWSSYHTWPH